MYNLLNKYGQLFAFGLGLLITLIYIISVVSGLSTFNSLPEGEEGTTGIFNFGLFGAIALIILCAALILGFGIYHAVQNPRGSLKFLIGLGVIILIFILTFAISEAETTGKLGELANARNLSDGISKYISGALKTALALALIAALAFIFSEIRNLFK